MTYITQLALALAVIFTGRHSRQFLGAILVTILVAGSLRVNADAAPGKLDTTFNGDGRQTTKFGTLSNAACAVAIQADGRIVVAGFVRPDGAESSFALARYLGS